MSRLTTARLRIDAPAADVWKIIGPGFDRVGDWASAIPHSTPIAAGPIAAAATPVQSTSVQSTIGSAVPGAGPLVVLDAPVAGRSCESTIPGMPTVSEEIVAYDDENMQLTYVGTSGLPRFVERAASTWQVRPDTDRSSVVTVTPTFTGRGPIGRILCTLMAPTLGHIGRVTVRDLAHYAEHGTPSPRKQRKMRR